MEHLSHQKSGMLRGCKKDVGGVTRLRGGSAALQYSPWLRRATVVLARCCPQATQPWRWRGGGAVLAWLGSLRAEAGASSTRMGSLLHLERSGCAQHGSLNHPQWYFQDGVFFACFSLCSGCSCYVNLRHKPGS